MPTSNQICLTGPRVSPCLDALADQHEFALDADAWAIFAAALERPPAVNPAVVDLIRRSRPA
jgi:uncharacterized protein (DUF1778 family)